MDPAATSTGGTAGTAAQEESPKERWGIMAGVPRSPGHGLHPQASSPTEPEPGTGREGRLRSPGQADLVPRWASDYLQTL